METLGSLIARTGAAACLECGKCTAACPVAREDAAFSPRRLVEEVIQGRWEAMLKSGALWSCLACRACHERCPMGVDYIGFVRGLRMFAQERGEEVPCSHGGLLQSMMRLMARTETVPERLGWLGEGLETAAEGETLYFVGCLPFFEVAFAELGFPALEIARSTVRLLNAAGIRPIVLPDERCCGHDLLWQGEVETFRKLAQANWAAIRRTGARQVITACAECARTLALDYPAFGYELGVEVVHLSRWLAEAMDGSLSFARADLRLAFQDPCRLGRHLGEYQAPRTVLAALGEPVEMAHSGRLAHCCGTSGWNVCGAVQKRLQRARLREARAAGADLLVTTCPKCQIHLRCAGDDPDVSERIPVRDLAVLAAEALRSPRFPASGE